MIRVQRTEERDVVRRLDRACFPRDDEPEIDASRWWLAYDGDEPVGFGGARFLRYEPRAMLLERCGVLEAWRGQRVQLRLIRARLRWAGERRADVVITYTMPGNVASSNSLIRAGFRLYVPPHAWAGHEALYWRHEL